MLHLPVPWNVVGLTEKQFPLTRTTRILRGFVCLCVFFGGGGGYRGVFETSQGLLNVK